MNSIIQLDIVKRTNTLQICTNSQTNLYEISKISELLWYRYSYRINKIDHKKRTKCVFVKLILIYPFFVVMKFRKLNQFIAIVFRNSSTFVLFYKQMIGWNWLNSLCCELKWCNAILISLYNYNLWHKKYNFHSHVEYFWTLFLLFFLQRNWFFKVC